MKIYFFRHGETDWNIEHKCQGQIMDPPIHLNDKGREQAKKTASLLKNKNLEMIFSSDLHRAKETAEIVAEEIGKIEIKYDSRLRETNFGDIQGLNPEERRKLDIDECITNHDIPFPNGESFNQLSSRAFDFLKYLVENYSYDRVGISTHGGLIGNVRSKLTGEKYRHTENGEILTIEYSKNTKKFEVINSNKIHLQTPSLSELDYRKKLLFDYETMSYNSGWNVDYTGYHYDTGCIDFPEEKWVEWHQKWTKTKDKFYAYIYDDNTPVGDVAFHYDEEFKAHSIHIVIEHKYRHRGYAKAALKLLIEEAFRNHNVETLIDSFPKEREESLRLFQSLGFKILRENEGLRFDKPCSGFIVELQKKDWEQ